MGLNRTPFLLWAQALLVVSAWYCASSGSFGSWIAPPGAFTDNKDVVMDGSQGPETAVLLRMSALLTLEWAWLGLISLSCNPVPLS